MMPFRVTRHEPYKLDAEHWMRKGMSGEEACDLVTALKDEIVHVNNVYHVTVRPLKHDPSSKWPSMVHVSIKRHDRRAVTSWRDLQEIKNMLLSPEHEAVQLFPAESRLVDSANQYHMWALATPGMRFPFGYTYRDVMTPEQAAALGCKQNKFRKTKSQPRKEK